MKHPAPGSEFGSPLAAQAWASSSPWSRPSPPGGLQPALTPPAGVRPTASGPRANPKERSTKFTSLRFQGIAGKTEFPVSLLRRALVCVDHREQARNEGECQQLAEDEIGLSLAPCAPTPTSGLNIAKTSPFSTPTASPSKITSPSMSSYKPPNNSALAPSSPSRVTPTTYSTPTPSAATCLRLPADLLGPRCRPGAVTPS